MAESQSKLTTAWIYHEFKVLYIFLDLFVTFECENNLLTWNFKRFSTELAGYSVSISMFKWVAVVSAQWFINE